MPPPARGCLLQEAGSPEFTVRQILIIRAMPCFGFTVMETLSVDEIVSRLK